MASHDFIEQLYKNIMGRKGLDAGISFWSKEIEKQSKKRKKGGGDLR